MIDVREVTNSLPPPAAELGERLKAAFLDNVNHELRTPLNLILGCNSLLADRLRTACSRDEEQLFATVGKAGHRLLQTMESILDMAMLEAGDYRPHPEPIELPTLVDEVITEFRPLAAEKGLELSSSVDEPEPIVVFDPRCLRRALSQLVSNAVKFTTTGSVEVAVRHGTNGAPRIDVVDTGPGIDETFLRILFTPFAQETGGHSRPFEGLGLGLALARRFVELGSGRITVSSRKGAGSRFSILFPSGSTKRETARRWTVLVVDRNPASRRYTRLLLADRFRVVEASTRRKADGKMKRYDDLISIAVVETSIRDSEEGLEFVRGLRARIRRPLPVVATAASPVVSERVQAIAAGCDAYLEKPLDYGELVGVMDRLLSGETTAASLLPLAGH